MKTMAERCKTKKKQTRAFASFFTENISSFHKCLRNLATTNKTTICQTQKTNRKLTELQSVFQVTPVTECSWQELYSPPFRQQWEMTFAHSPITRPTYAPHKAYLLAFQDFKYILEPTRFLHPATNATYS